MGLRFRPQGLRFRPVGLRFRPQGLRFRPQGLRFRPVGLRFRPQGLRFRPQGLRFRPRNLVYDLMTELDPDGLERRGSVGKRKHKRGAAGTFTSMVSVFFIRADSSAHNLCSEILEVKPLDYALHIAPVRCYVVDFSSVYPLLYLLKML